MSQKRRFRKPAVVSALVAVTATAAALAAVAVLHPAQRNYRR